MPPAFYKHVDAIERIRTQESITMRLRHSLAFSLLTVLIFAAGAIPVFAQKGGKGGNSGKGGGGGGGDDGGSTPSLPPITYEVDFQPIEGMRYGGVRDVTSDGQVLVGLDVATLTASVPTAWPNTLGVVAPDGSVIYPELDPGTIDWDFPSSLAWINDSGCIASTGVNNGEIRAFVYVPPVSSEELGQVIGDDGAPEWTDTVQVHAFTNDGKVLLRYLDWESSLVEQWVWLPFDGIRIPIGVSEIVNGEPVFREDLSFSRLTMDGRLYGAYVDGSSVTGYFQSDVVSDSPFSFVNVDDASDSGFSINVSSTQVKRKGQYAGVPTITTYDVDGNSVASETLDWGVQVPRAYLGEDTVNGVPIFAASIGGIVPKNLWVKIPGFDSFTVTDLMSTAALADWQSIDFGGDANADTGGSTAFPECYSPVVSVSGAPAFVGDAYRIDPGYLGIYRITPVPAP